MTVQSRLGEAWTEAEASLPDGWAIHILQDTGWGDVQNWLVVAGPRRDHGRTVMEYGDTPEEALRALASRPNDDPSY